MIETQFAAESEKSQSQMFVERRSGARMTSPGNYERRQFYNSHDELSPEAKELAMAVDSFKLRHRRRFIGFEEILAVVRELGYARV